MRMRSRGMAAMRNFLVALCWAWAGGVFADSGPQIGAHRQVEETPIARQWKYLTPTSPTAQSVKNLPVGTKRGEVLIAQNDEDGVKGESEPNSLEDLFSSDEKEVDEETTQSESIEGLFDLGDDEQPEEKSALRLMGYYQNELAYTYPDPAHFSKWRNTLQFGSQGRFGDRTSWKASARVVYDPIYWLDDFYPEDVKDDQGFWAQIRETYLDIEGQLDFRLGRQHIVWGEVVGIFVADVVSARDRRDFWGTDLDQVRIPQWAARGEYFAGDFHAEAIWIPYMTYDDIGVPGAEFYPLQLPPSLESNTRIAGEEQPKGLSESAYGARLSYLIGGWDGSLFYYSSMDRSAAFERRIVTEPERTAEFRPIHDRIYQLGGTLSKDLGLSLLKVEAVYTKDRLFGTNEPSEPTGLVKKDQFEYILSLETAFQKETNLNLQFSQQRVLDHDPGVLVDDVDSFITVSLNTRALHPKVEPQIFFLRSLDRTEWLLRAQALWEFARNWYVVAGIDVFEGEDGAAATARGSGFIGRLDAKDRVFYELRYTF